MRKESLVRLSKGKKAGEGRVGRKVTSQKLEVIQNRKNLQAAPRLYVWKAVICCLEFEEGDRGSDWRRKKTGKGREGE